MIPIIQIKNLQKTYGKNVVLNNIDLEVERGDFFALLGYNGAGKTTLISILTNLVNKDAGKIHINGIDIDTNFAQARQYIGVVPQEFNFDIFAKVEQIPLLQAGYYGVPRKEAIEKTEYYLKKLGLREKRQQKAKTLSGGMKRRLMIVRALVHEPEILILDEPTAGVDVELRKSMWQFIEELHKKGKTIILTTHYLEEVEELCKKVAIINKGNIIENTTTRKLLGKLKKELIVLDIKGKIPNFSSDFIQKYKPKVVEENSLEVELGEMCSINKLIGDLTDLEVEVTSFRNKGSRLEQLFLNIMHEYDGCNHIDT